MGAFDPRGCRPTLVVGGGLTGAALAFIAARSGAPTMLVSADRPASQSTALSPGIVHGTGPPGDAADWDRLTPAAIAAAGHRDRHGYDLLRELLLASPRQCGFRRVPHVMLAPESSADDWVVTTGTRLAAAGWDTEPSLHASGPALRSADAIVDARRLAFEALRLAQASGLSIHIGERFGGILEITEKGLVVRLGRAAVPFGRVVWAAGGRPMPSSPRGLPGIGAHPRLLLHQVLAPGREPLRGVHETADGTAVLAPDPLFPARNVLVRIARQQDDGRVLWPDVPGSWEPFVGAVRRDRLAEIALATPSQPYLASRDLIVMSGLARWPIASRLGACLEAWTAAN